MARLWDEMRQARATDLELDLGPCGWLDANMCAPLGAILTADGRGVTPLNMRRGLQEILQKSGFFDSLGFDLPRLADVHGTTIEFKRFPTTETGAFRGYVADQFVGKGLPPMTRALRRKFRESLAELFENAKEHSETQQGVFACGQWFPNGERLNFSVADLGIGIRKRILRSTGRTMSSERAIAWAVAGNTTRDPRAGRPGGLGLKIITEFVKLNGGSLQIASGRGYWRLRPGQDDLRELTHPFPGTVVNIGINTADTQSYCLDREIDPRDVF